MKWPWISRKRHEEAVAKAVEDAEQKALTRTLEYCAVIHEIHRKELAKARASLVLRGDS